MKDLLENGRWSKKQHVYSFRFVDRFNLNILLWDECVLQSSEGLIYGHAFFLDDLSPGWSAIIHENYEWVLPVIANKKFGVSYLYQPPFTQQLGLYAKPGVEVPIDEIISWLKAKYSFWEISWNKATASLVEDEKIITTSATNYILDLSKDYKSIAQNYHNDLVKNLKKSTQFAMQYQPSKKYKTCIDLYVEHYAKRTPNISKNDYANFSKLCHFAEQNNMLLCRDAVNEKGEILSTALLLFDGKRLYNMMNTTTDEGRKMSSNHFIIDSIIREFAGQPYIFDFEGSDLPGVKSFYENFGAANEPYFHIKYNNLPWPAKLLKQ